MNSLRKMRKLLIVKIITKFIMIILLWFLSSLFLNNWCSNFAHNSYCFCLHVSKQFYKNFYLLRHSWAIHRNLYIYLASTNILSLLLIGTIECNKSFEKCIVLHFLNVCSLNIILYALYITLNLLFVHSNYSL